MAAAKPPPGNLKDRIAALQQRNATHPDQKHADIANTLRTAGSLRDKIASFEKQGAVPVPRGSFGLGAPPVDDGSSRRRGELMGNRVPGLSRPVVPAVPVHPPRVASPTPPGRKRCVSASDSHSSVRPIRSPSPTFSADKDASSQDGGSGKTLLDGPMHSRQPSEGRTHETRRSVSDVLPKLVTPHSMIDPLLENSDEAEMPTPVIVVSTDLQSVTSVISSPDDAAFTETAISRDLADDTVMPEPDSQATQEQYIEGAPSELPAHQQGVSPVTDGLPHADFDIARTSSPEQAISPVETVLQQTSVATEDVPEAVPASKGDMGISETTLEHNRDGVEATLTVRHEEGRPTDESRSTLDTVIETVQLSVTLDSSDHVDTSVDADIVSLTDRTSASSSKVSTPLDHVAFPSIEPASRKEVELQDVDDLADQSLALDSSEAIIVREPARIVSPIVSRAILVPVPQGLSPTASSTSKLSNKHPIPAIPVPTASPYTEPSLTPKTANGSFRAVVHRKVTEGATESSRRSISPPFHTPSRPKASMAEFPQSPGFGDLADLVANAALLEQQLSGLGSPRQSTAREAAAAPPKPEISLKPTSPVKSEQVSPSISVSLAAHPSPILETPAINDDSSGSQYASLQEFPSTSLKYQVAEPVTPPPPSKERSRTRILSDTPPPPVPSKSPRPRYFSTLISRKPSTNGMLSMPGAYPRNSVCSEMSEDDSVLVSTPPSPRFDSLGSDTSSVRSSSKSWKMPKKGLSRATSFADKLWHKKGNRNTVIIASPGKQHLHVGRSRPSLDPSLNLGSSEDDVHLSADGVQPRTPPTPTLPRLEVSANLRPQNGSMPQERPTSWVSISSAGSGGFDNALFDAFPSVPSDVPSFPSLASQPDSSSNLPSAGHLDSSASANRFSTLPAYSGHQKGRSSYV